MTPSLIDALLVVDVVDEKIQRRDALAQAALDHLPLAARDDARDDIEGEDLLLPGAVAVHGKGDAGVEERALGGLLAAAEVAFVQGVDQLRERVGLGPDAAVALEHLIEELLVFVAAKLHGA